MVSLDEWDDTQIKIKILLKGSSGTGKTRVCTKIAGILARKGYNCLYLDGEKGAEKEFKNLKKDLTKEEMKRINYVYFKDYKEMVSSIIENINKKGDKLKLIVVDPMRLIEIARLSARDIYLAQGSAPSGYGMKDIKNKDSFDLSGTGYQLASTMVLKFLNDLINYNQDIICCLTIKETSKDEYKYKNEYDASFDYVFETLAEPHGNKMVFKSYPKKRRGAKTPDATLIDDLLGEIVAIFKEKYIPSSTSIVTEQVQQNIDPDKKEEIKEGLQGGSEINDNMSTNTS